MKKLTDLTVTKVDICRCGEPTDPDQTFCPSCQEHEDEYINIPCSDKEIIQALLSILEEKLECPEVDCDEEVCFEEWCSISTSTDYSGEIPEVVSDCSVDDLKNCWLGYATSLVKKSKIKEDKNWYCASIIPDQGGYSVIFVDFLECHTQGRTIKEAYDNAKEALQEHIKLMVKDGDKLPDRTGFYDVEDKLKAYYASLGMGEIPKGVCTQPIDVTI